VRLLFSGDVGGRTCPSSRIRSRPPAEYLIWKTTETGLHAPMGDVKAKLAGLVKSVLARGGHMIVPAVCGGEDAATGAAAARDDRGEGDPDFPIFVDSPLASAVTGVFEKASGGVGCGCARLLREG